MTIPTPIIVLLALLALPTAMRLIVAFDAWAATRTLRLFGRADDFRDDGTYTMHWCALYLPVWRETGCHSSWLPA